MVCKISVLALFLVAGLAFSQSAAEVPGKITPLLIGSKTPEMVLKDQNGAEQQLSQLFSQQPTVLMFYRGGW